MKKRELGLNCCCRSGVDRLTVLEWIKAAGFTHTFSHSYRAEEVRALKNKAYSLGLQFDFLHAPTFDLNNIWLNGDAFLTLQNALEECIDSAAETAIPVVVMHVSAGKNPPQICDVGLKRFDALVDRAARKNIKIAFENMRKFGNHAYIMERYETAPNVGFCYDLGHENCFTPNVPYLDLYGKRLLCTHVHDNFGVPTEPDVWDDLHLLPFDGDLNFKAKLQKLDECGFSGCLMLELKDKYRPAYKDMQAEAFIFEAFQRAKRLLEL